MYESRTLLLSPALCGTLAASKTNQGLRGRPVSSQKCWRQRCLAWRSSHRDWRRRRCDDAIRSVGGVSITSTLSTGLFLQARLASVVPSGATPLTAPASRPITAPAATAPAAAPRPVAGDAAGALAAYRQLLSTQLAKVVDAAEGVGGHVLTATRILAEGFQREAAVVEAFGACKVRMRAHCCWQLWLQHLLRFWMPACLPAYSVLHVRFRFPRATLHHSSLAEARCRRTAAVGAASGRQDGCCR